MDRESYVPYLPRLISDNENPSKLSKYKEIPLSFLVIYKFATHCLNLQFSKCYLNGKGSFLHVLGVGDNVKMCTIAILIIFYILLGIN